MIKPDFRGARGSNAGDDFHELWALRQSLSLLEQDTELLAVTVEGLKEEDETGEPETWDGVDCGYYYGGDTVHTAERLVIEQLKYSPSDPNKKWTIARLIKSDAKKTNNSVIKRLANAFTGIQNDNPNLISNKKLAIRFVSNQPVDQKVIQTLADAKSKNTDELKSLVKASGLKKRDFLIFAETLDFSHCGNKSRFAVQERIIKTISEWTEDDARTAVTGLLASIRRKMMPESKAEYISAGTILTQLGVSDRRALFPCPPAIKKVDRLVPRKIARDLVDLLISGDQRICLHGNGGCGKTTALQEMEQLLPEGSISVIFDCYGAGRYLDSDAYRHRTVDAFLQLSNELAEKCRTPLLMSPSNVDYPRVFKKRLEKAAEVVSSISKEALLVIAIDAADNSVTAANTRSPKETSFVHEFFSLGELPANVRFVVTARTGRLQSLSLPSNFSALEINGFHPDETAQHVREFWGNAADDWIADFHHLSQGNPRVQRYALDYAGKDLSTALEYLRPNGKSLNNVFHEQLQHANRKFGDHKDVKVFCSGLIALPRPVPIDHLAEIIGSTNAGIRDLCADLAPGIRLLDGYISFADEDFEHFIRDEAQDHLTEVQTRSAEYFLNIHKTDPYAAAHIANALFEANCGEEILTLIKTEKEPSAIGDPVLRRDAQLQRLKLAMKVCRQSGDTAEAILTLLSGADALKTDSAIHKMLVDNPDLAANFARDASSRIILRDPAEIENHGPLLFHTMAFDARKSNGILVREGSRQLHAWLQRREDAFAEQRQKFNDSNRHGWSIDFADIAAQVEAVLRIKGSKDAVAVARSWNPKLSALWVASHLSYSLMASGDEDLFENCVKEVRTPWKLFLLTPLSLTDKKVSVATLETCLKQLFRRGMIKLDKITETYDREKFYNEYTETILTACEIVISRGGNKNTVIPILEKLSALEFRQQNSLYTSQTALLDISLRAFTLLEYLSGRVPALDTYLIKPPIKSGDDREISNVRPQTNQNESEIAIFISQFFAIYDTRAKVILGEIALDSCQEPIEQSISRSLQENYKLRNEYKLPEMRKRAALSISRLMILKELDRDFLLKSACRTLNASAFNSAETEVLRRFAIEHTLHSEIFKLVKRRAEEVRAARTSSEDKIEALIRFSRLVLPFSYHDAESFFNEALAVAGETNYDAIHELALFAPLSKNAVTAMSRDDRRQAAGKFAVLASDTSIRLDGNDNFPWNKIAQTLSELDICLAFAAVGRWEDDSIVSRNTVLPEVMTTAISNKNLSVAQAVSLFPLLDIVDEELLSRIADEISANSDDAGKIALIEEIAREELLRFGEGKRNAICDKLNSISTKSERSYWLEQLNQSKKFHEAHQEVKENSYASLTNPGGISEYEAARIELLNNFDWKKHKYTSAEEINQAVKEVLDAAAISKTFLSVNSILERMGTYISFGNRVPHLNALINSESKIIDQDDVARIVTRLVKEWSDSAAVESWNRQYIRQLIVDNLPVYTRYLSYDQAMLPELLKRSGEANNQICEILLQATERHVDALDAPTVFALVGLIGQYCSPEVAAKVINIYSDRLIDRIAAKDRDTWELNDIPDDPDESFARYIYAMMSDVDVRNRWRAGHSLRILGRQGDVSTIDRVIKLYDNKTEGSYRKPNTPFYWIASRLWLVISIARIANETPAAVKHLTEWLLKIAVDEAFPHVILREFAKSAIANLTKSNEIVLTHEQQKSFEQINASAFAKVKPKKSRRPYFDKYHYKERENRRFRFDSMDTLPDWYAGKARMFVDMDTEDFIDVAEKWIVDKWGVEDNPWMWNQEPRKVRLESHPLERLSSNSHGSRPVAERYSTHLEWHAMWCAIGELLKSRPMLEIEDHYYTLEESLERNGLSAPPFWMTDFRDAKPLEKRFWFGPERDVDSWIENIEDEDFLGELRISGSEEFVVVGGDFEARSRDFSLSVNVDTALVSPETAAALVKTFQTTEDPWFNYLPFSGDENEIDSPPYRLLGWLLNDYSESGLDERDPFRNMVTSIHREPSEGVVSDLNLKFVLNNHPQWLKSDDDREIFFYRSWSDFPWDDYSERSFYDSKVRSTGWQLMIDKSALKKYLNHKELDLIVKIKIIRKNNGYEYSRSNEKETKEAQFERVFVFRRNGTIEAAEKRFGTW